MKPAPAPPMTAEQQAAHVAVVKAANAKADAAMKPALDLYAERNWFFRKVCEVSLRDLRRLRSVIEHLSEADIKRVCAFAEGLAEWSGHEPESPDAQGSDRS